MKRKPSPILDPARIGAFAELAKTMPISPPLNFYDLTLPDGKKLVFDDMYPPQNAPQVIEFFFFAMIHQYGFWHDEDERYKAPLYGSWKGKDGVKGSDLLWKMLMGAWQRNRDCFLPANLAYISDQAFDAIFSDDNGPVPLLCTDERRNLTREYGRWFSTPRMAGRTPTELVAYANTHPDPVFVLRAILTHDDDGIPGYREDPFGKKAELLLMALANRPEKLLATSAETTWFPVIDYHVMRLALRMALCELPAQWRKENTERKFVTEEREAAIRDAVNRSVKIVIDRSGRSMAEIDNLMWSARRYCPETETPQCAKCPLRDVCAQKVELFQPVIRTTYY